MAGGVAGGGGVGEDVGGGGVVGAGVAPGGFDGVGVEDDDLGDAGGGVAVLDDDAVVAFVAEFLGADGAGVGGGAGGEAGVGGGLVGGVFEGDEDGIGVLSVSGGVLAVGGEVGALDVHGGAASGGVEGADAGGVGVVPEDAGFAVLVEEFLGDGLGVVFPVAEEAFEVGGADVDPEVFGEVGAFAVGCFEPGGASLVAAADGVALCLWGVGDGGVFDAAGGIDGVFRRCRRCRRRPFGATVGGGGVFGDGAEEAAFGVFEGEGGVFGEDGLDGIDDGRVLLVGAGVVLGEGEDVLAAFDAIGDAVVLIDGVPNALGLGGFVVGLDGGLDGGGGPVVGGDGDAGRELGLEGGEECCGFGGGFGGEAGDGGGAVGEVEGDAFAEGEAADVVGVDRLEFVFGAVACAGEEVGEVCAYVGDYGVGVSLGFDEGFAVRAWVEAPGVEAFGLSDEAVDDGHGEDGPVAVDRFVRLWDIIGVRGGLPLGRHCVPLGFA